MSRRVLVTGGAGFIGSAVCRHLVHSGCEVLNLDKLTYAGNLPSLQTVSNVPHYSFRQVDICDGAAIAEAFAAFRPDHVMHLAAESHVDRSIAGADDFVNTNIVGTFIMLTLALTPDDFEPEQGQVDGALHHAIERVFTLAAIADGYAIRDSRGRHLLEPLSPPSPASTRAR